MSPFCAELLCPTEQAQLDILNPQVQACCDELICNESFWIQVHCHELELFFLYWWYQNLKCYFQVSYLLLGSQIGFFLNEKGLTQGILRRYFLTPDHFSNTSTLITSGTSLQWLSYKVTHLRPSIVRVKGDLQRISRQPLSVRARTVSCYGVPSGQVCSAHPRLLRINWLAKGHFAEVKINVVRPSAMVKASAHWEVQRDGLAGA